MQRLARRLGDLDPAPRQHEEVRAAVVGIRHPPDEPTVDEALDVVAQRRRGQPDASETRVGLTGARSRTCVSSASRNPGIPTGSSCASTIRPTSCEVVAALRKSCLFVIATVRCCLARAVATFTASTQYLAGGSDETVARRCGSAHRSRRRRRRGGRRRPAATGSWVGTYTLGGPDELSLTLSGKRALVALGAGHADLQSVPLVDGGGEAPLPAARPAGGARLRRHDRGRRLDGNGAPGRATRHVLGPARQRAGARRLVGFYETGGGQTAVVDDPYGPARLVDLESGQGARALPGGSGVLDRVGLRDARAERRGRRGSARGRPLSTGSGCSRCACARSRCGSAAVATRSPGRCRSPPGPASTQRAVFVHGSGPTQRAYLPELSALLVRHGVAVLVYDKRGIGQSSGRYPGESPTAGTIDTLARDAAGRGALPRRAARDRSAHGSG